MRHQQPSALVAIEDDPAAPDAKGTHPVDGLAEQLWAEHGWSLTALDVAGLVIAVLVVSVFLA